MTCRKNMNIIGKFISTSKSKRVQVFEVPTIFVSTCLTFSLDKLTWSVYSDKRT